MNPNINSYLVLAGIVIHGIGFWYMLLTLPKTITKSVGLARFDSIPAKLMPVAILVGIILVVVGLRIF